MPALRRRGALALMPAAVAACASPPPPEPPLPPVGYAYLTPLPLNVGALRIEDAIPPAPPGDIGARLVPTPAEAVRTMARDRLSAVGTGGEAVFQVTRATLVRSGDGLACQLACRLEVTGAEEGERGFVEATARAAASGAEAARPQAADRLLRRAMDGLNVELEFQVRRNLRPWLVMVAPGSRGALPAPPAGEVAREELPRS